jgi:hypothetical protein
VHDAPSQQVGEDGGFAGGKAPCKTLASHSIEIMPYNGQLLNRAEWCTIGGVTDLVIEAIKE